MSLQEIFILILLALLLWFWFNTLRIRERAVQAAARACGQAEVLLLDESVAMSTWSLTRIHGGSMVLKRVYAFEFASDGGQRYAGQVTMLGPYTAGVEMDAYRLPMDD